MRKALGIASIIAIGLIEQGGCVAGDQAVPNVQYKPVLVDHPVPCVPVDKKPVLPGPLGSRPADARQAVPTLLAKVREWEGYGDHAQPLLDACTKLP